MNRYLVVEPEQLVAEDLADAIRAHDPGARVETLRSVAEVWPALSVSRPRAVILSLDPQRFAETALGRELAAQGIPHAFLCLWGDTESGGAIRLASPFSEATVAALLARLAEPGE